MKKILVAILITALLLSFAGCKPPSDGYDNADPLANGEVHTDFHGIETRIAQVYTEDGKTKLKVIWCNNTDYEVMYGEPYTIQRLDGNKWVNCSKNEMTAFITVGYSLKAGKEILKTYTISDLFDVSQPGTYRFKSSCSVYVDGKDRQDCALWAEFKLGNVTRPDDSKENDVEVQWAAQYIRTNGYCEGVLYPSVRIIGSLQALKDYYNTWCEVFDLERKEKLYSDTTIGFLDACDQYDDAFFEKNYLILVLLEEGSGSIHHEVRSVQQTADKKISISIDRKVPEVGTADMAEWHIILELSRDVLVEKSIDTCLYVDGSPSYMDDKVVIPQAEASFKEPPAGSIRTPEEDADLHLGGYAWIHSLDNSHDNATIADQNGRPIPKEALSPITISSRFAETVYAPIAGTNTYAPTNSSGYLVKLQWEINPTSVTYTCWPETVWERGNVPEEKVVAQDGAFYAKPGGYVYEIVATWGDFGMGYQGSANYYVYIVGGNDPTYRAARLPEC